MKKYDIVYDNNRLHDKRQISLKLNIPEDETKEPDDLKTDDSVLHEEVVQESDELDCIPKGEIEFAEGQIFRERLVMYKPEKEDSEDEYIPRSSKANDYHGEQIHHKPRTMDGEEFPRNSFLIRMNEE